MAGVYPEPAEIPAETRRRLLEEARKRGIRARDLGVSRSFYSQMLRGVRRVPDRVVSRLLEVLPDDAVLSADPGLFSGFLAYTRIEVPVDLLVERLVEWMERHPAAAKLLVSRLNMEAERLGITGKAYKITKRHVEEFDAYLASRTTAGDLSKNTAGDYRRYLRKALDMLGWILTKHNIRRLIRRLQAENPGVANHTYKALKLFIREVLQDKELAMSVPRPRVRWSSPRAPPWEDICATADAMPYGSPPRVFLLFLATTGLRVYTAHRLDIESLDLEERIVRVWDVKATKRSYFTFIPPRLAEELRAYLEYRRAYLEAIHRKSQRLFPYKYKRLKEAVYKAQEEAGVDKFMLKQLRKRFAEHMSHHLSSLELNVLMGHAPREVVEKHYLLKDTIEDLQAKYDKAITEIPCI